MSLPRLWLFLAVALPVLASLIASMSTVDLTYHLRAGAEIIDDLAIPTTDRWTFTAAGMPWVDQQWGAQVVLASAERLGSWTGLVLLRGVLAAIIFGCLALITRRHGVPARVSALVLLAAFVVAAPAMALRPQLLGMACFAVVLLLADARRDRPRWLWLIPVVVAVWANLHGSFFLGPVVLGLAWLADVHDHVEGRHRTMAIAALSAIGACLTPFGPWVWAYAVGLSANPEVTARISEWQPTVIRDASGALFFASLAAVVALIARRGSATSWPTLVWLGVFGGIALYAQRGVAWWALAAVVALAPMLSTSARRAPAGEVAGAATALASRRLDRLNGVVAGLLVVTGIAVLPIWRPVTPGLGAPEGVLEHAPAGITQALATMVGPGDRILNDQLWGSWLEYAVPAATVAVDSRIELFAPETWRAYGAILAGSPGWEATLEQWDPDVIVLGTEHEPVMTRLESTGWSRAFTDADGSILTRP